MAISVNVLGLPQPDVSALVDWCVKARPPYAVVMDGADIATRIGMASPNTQIIFRRYRPDDHKLHEVMTPAAFMDSVADLPRSWIAQVGNEPGGDQAQLAAWCAGAILAADQRERRLALPNFSTGNPDPEAVADGLYDPLWRAMAASGRHVLGLHEYALVDPASEPWHISRFRNILRRFDALGLKRPEVVITEHGRDLAGGRDGWRTVFNEQQYTAFLETAQEVYRPDGITACVFSWGSGFEGRWSSYDVQGAPDLLRAMATMNAGAPGTPDVPQEEDVVPWGLKQAKTGPKGVNLRAEPKLSAPIIRVVNNGEYLRPYGTPVNADQHRWQRVNDENCKTGWVSLNVLELE